ncbi:MAG: carbohydrate ABC transporter permease [Armatimonadota bacterium]
MKPRRTQQAWGWEFVAPALLIIGMFVVIPCLWGIALSFTQFDAIGSPRYIGVENYARLKDDPLVWSTLLNTAIYVLLTLPTSLALSLAIAVTLHQKWFVGRSFARAIYFLPHVTSLAAVAFVWEWLLNPEYGLINAGLRWLGFAGPGWLSDPNLAMPSVAAVGVWHGLGFGVLIYLAGLRSIPEEVHEAAKIDGAGGWQTFKFVTWPLLTPTTMFLTMMGMIGGFQVFQSVYIMTNGGPLDRTRVYLFYLWQSAFRNLEMGYASAMAVLLFVIILVLTLLQRHFYERRLKTWQ